MKDSVAPFFFAFLSVVMLANVNLLSMDYLIRSFTGSSPLSELLWDLSKSKGDAKIAGLVMTLLISLILASVILYKDRYVSWFSAYAHESNESRKRGTMFMYSYFLITALLIAAMFLSISYHSA